MIPPRQKLLTFVTIGQLLFDSSPPSGHSLQRKRPNQNLRYPRHHNLVPASPLLLAQHLLKQPWLTGPRKKTTMGTWARSDSAAEGRSARRTMSRARFHKTGTTFMTLRDRITTRSTDRVTRRSSRFVNGKTDFMRIG